MTALSVYILALSAGFTATEAHVATCIAFYESSFRPKVLNVNKGGSVDTGLMQINQWWTRSGYCAKYDLLDPEDNMKCANEIYNADNKNWNMWVGYRLNKATCDKYRTPVTSNSGLSIGYSEQEQPGNSVVNLDPKCPSTKIIDDTDRPWSIIDEEAQIRAKHVCKTQYSPNECLVELHRRPNQHFHAICGAKR